MEKINRIKAVLAEEGKTGKWLAEQVVATGRQYQNGAPTHRNLICPLCGALLMSLI